MGWGGMGCQVVVSSTIRQPTHPPTNQPFGQSVSQSTNLHDTRCMHTYTLSHGVGSQSINLHDTRCLPASPPPTPPPTHTCLAM